MGSSNDVAGGSSGGNTGVNINDNTTSTETAWSSFKINQQLLNKVDIESLTYLNPGNNNTIVI